MCVSEIVQQHAIKKDASMKQNSKVQKVITVGSIFAFFNSTTTYWKSNEKQKAFIDDLVLVVVKGLLPLNTIENLSMRWFGLQTNPQLVFPSHKNIIEEILFCMMKCTLEEFVLPYVNAIFSITTTFYLSTKVHLIILPLWLLFLHWIGSWNISQLIYLRLKTIIEINFASQL
jgi:hypothetical protein